MASLEEGFSVEFQVSYKASECEMLQVDFRKCGKYGKQLQLWASRRLGKVYGCRFLRCPDFRFSYGHDGNHILPFLDYIGVIMPSNHTAPTKCFFELVDDRYPKGAQICISKLIEKLESMEAELAS